MIIKKEVEKLSGENEKRGGASPNPRRFLILEEKFIVRILILHGVNICLVFGWNKTK